MLSSQSLKDIRAEARLIIERQLNDAVLLAGLRDVVTAQGGDWGALKALIKAEIQDEQNDTGERKKLRKVTDRAGFTTQYAEQLGLNMNEFNNSQDERDAA